MAAAAGDRAVAGPDVDHRDGAVAARRRRAAARTACGSPRRRPARTGRSRPGRSPQVHRSPTRRHRGSAGRRRRARCRPARTRRTGSARRTRCRSAGRPRAPAARSAAGCRSRSQDRSASPRRPDRIRCGRGVAGRRVEGHDDVGRPRPAGGDVDGPRRRVGNDVAAGCPAARQGCRPRHTRSGGRCTCGCRGRTRCRHRSRRTPCGAARRPRSRSGCRRPLTLACGPAHPVCPGDVAGADVDHGDLAAARRDVCRVHRLGDGDPGRGVERDRGWAAGGSRSGRARCTGRRRSRTCRRRAGRRRRACACRSSRAMPCGFGAGVHELRHERARSRHGARPLQTVVSIIDDRVVLLVEHVDAVQRLVDDQRTSRCAIARAGQLHRAERRRGAAGQVVGVAGTAVDGDDRVVAVRLVDRVGGLVDASAERSEAAVADREAAVVVAAAPGWCALQVRVSKASKPSRVATYAVWVRWLTSTSPGPSDVAKHGAGVVGQPPGVAALQVAGVDHARRCCRRSSAT